MLVMEVNFGWLKLKFGGRKKFVFGSFDNSSLSFFVVGGSNLNLFGVGSGFWTTLSFDGSF